MNKLKKLSIFKKSFKPIETMDNLNNAMLFWALQQFEDKLNELVEALNNQKQNK